jgi:single-strand DNA-binding protein
MSELKFPEVNRVFLSGRLTRDPEARYAADGTQVTSFAIAFHRRYRGRDGRFAEQAGFVSVLTYQRLAEVCGERLKKGNAVLVEGRLQMREWTTRQGGAGQRLEVRADLVHFLERAPGEGVPTAEPELGPPREGEPF